MPIFELTKEMTAKLQFLFKNQPEQATVYGDLDKFLAKDEKKAKVKALAAENGSVEASAEEEEKTEKVNWYKELDLEAKEKTNLLTRICTALDVNLATRKKNMLSPKNDKGKGAKTKVLQKKKTTVRNATNSDLKHLESEHFVVAEMVLEPYFRYLPDRGTMQRLIMRAANMKDDLEVVNVD